MGVMEKKEDVEGEEQFYSFYTKKHFYLKFRNIFILTWTQVIM